MNFVYQIAAGSAVLALCALAHILVLICGISVLKRLGVAQRNRTTMASGLWIISLAFAVVVFGHTVQTWIWGAAFFLTGALPDFADAIYFALVTTTTLGYGDITLEPGQRIFGAMAAVSGLLTFGLSTAFLIKTVEAVLTASDTRGSN